MKNEILYHPAEVKLAVVCECVLCCPVHTVTYLFNLCNNGVAVIAVAKLVSYGLHNPCCDWATGTGEGKSLLSHGDLKREQKGS